MLPVSWLGAVVLAASPFFEAPCPAELFRISNNRSTNVVVYQSTSPAWSS